MSELDEIYNRINGEYDIDKRIKNEKSEVQEFYSNKTLFITGATGFMGKCLLEKLLRSCSDLKHIYLLIRPTSNYSIEERLRKLFQHEIFNSLRTSNSGFEKKVTAMEGELFLKNLGLSDKNRDIIKQETNIMFHNAANVKFYERVNVTLKVNVLGTKHMLDLAEECNNLETFVYVSTAFSHCNNKHIEEKCYQPPGDLKMVYDMIDADLNSKHGLSKDAVKMLLGDHRVIYTFSKAISEELVRQRGEKSTFACGIYRPSVVLPTLKEPIPGWAGNKNGPVLLFLGSGLGIFHVSYHDRETPTDMVPCDMSINALLAVTWDLPNRWATEQKTVVYNYTSSTVNPIGIMGLYDHLKNIEGPDRSAKAVWMNFIFVTQRFWLFLILHILFHMIPAFLLDLCLLLTFKKPRVVLFAWQMSQHYDLINYFGSGNWRIYMPETLKVVDRLNTVDRELFFCDLRLLDWKEFCNIFWKGLKVHFLKESMDSKASTRRYKLLWYLHYGLITVLVLTFSYFIMRLVM